MLIRDFKYIEQPRRKRRSPLRTLLFTLAVSLGYAGYQLTLPTNSYASISLLNLNPLLLQITPAAPALSEEALALPSLAPATTNNTEKSEPTPVATPAASHFTAANQPSSFKEFIEAYEATTASESTGLLKTSLTLEAPGATAARPSLQTSTPQRLPQTTASPATTTVPWQNLTIKSGDTLSAIFNKADISAGQLHELISVDKKNGNYLTSLVPGEALRLHQEDGVLQKLEYHPSLLTSVHYHRQGSGFKMEVNERAPDSIVTHAKGVINSSFYLSGLEAGLSEKLILDVATIFGWDIDFALDIRKQDTFVVIYEELFVDGKKYGDGAVLAAEFVNNGKRYQALRFADNKGNVNYYTPDGQSMRKAFLRSPVDFRRISSGFQRERFHPVLGKKRPHRGVDYAAASGTPIKASGDGSVIELGTKGGYGQTIVLQHANKYTTLYAHMSSYKGGLKIGSRVKQGDTIGYVGKTGLATGPHLHYEFRINGEHRNPLTVALPNADPIPKQQRANFTQHSAKLVMQLDQISKTQLALKSE
ncbi:MAG: peptidoglycan DD-metalloendopeptidase family protein [Gammaproteobacteria bacterium]|nr:peptidoglycan DD-metalloendopeptidase family protein [Gammaproteobacteria bacterium]